MYNEPADNIIEKVAAETGVSSHAVRVAAHLEDAVTLDAIRQAVRDHQAGWGE